MKNKKGFTLVELLAVIVILAVIILIAINAVLPQMERARKNSFADEVMNYAKAAEARYVSENADDESIKGDISKGICYSIGNLHGEYVSKNDGTYTGIVVIKKRQGTNNLYDKYVYLKSSKYSFNSTATKSVALDTDSNLEKISGKNVSDGGSLTFTDCCDFEKSSAAQYTTNPDDYHCEMTNN